MMCANCGYPLAYYSERCVVLIHRVSGSHRCESGSTFARKPD